MWFVEKQWTEHYLSVLVIRESLSGKDTSSKRTFCAALYHNMLGQVGHKVPVHEIREAHMSGMFYTCISADPTYIHTHGYLYVTWSVWLGYGSICMHMGQNSLPTSVQRHFTLIILTSSSPALVPLLIINHHWFCGFLTLNVSAQTCTVGGSDKSPSVPPVFLKLHPHCPCDWPFFAFRETVEEEKWGILSFIKPFFPHRSDGWSQVDQLISEESAVSGALVLIFESQNHSMQRLDVRVIRFALSEQRIKDFSNKRLQSQAGSHLNEGTHSDLSVIPVYRYYKCGESIMINFVYLININVPGLQQLLRKIRVHKRSSEQKQDLQQLHNSQSSLLPAALWRLLALKRPAPVRGCGAEAAAAIQRKVTFRVAAKSHSGGGGSSCLYFKRPLYVRESWRRWSRVDKWQKQKWNSACVRSLNKNRIHVTHCFSFGWLFICGSLSIWIGASLMCKCHSESSKP